MQNNKPDSARALADEAFKVKSAMAEIEGFRRRGLPIPSHFYTHPEYKSALSQLLHGDIQRAAYKKTNDPRVLGGSVPARAAALRTVNSRKPSLKKEKVKGFR